MSTDQRIEQLIDQLASTKLNLIDAIQQNELLKAQLAGKTNHIRRTTKLDQTLPWLDAVRDGKAQFSVNETLCLIFRLMIENQELRGEYPDVSDSPHPLTK